MEARGPLPNPRQTLLILASLALIAGCGDASSDPASDASPASEDADLPADPDDGDAGPRPDRLRIMSYNIKHAELSSLDDLGDTIAVSGAEVVALQEVDKDAPRSGEVHQALRLGQLSGMAASFRRSIVLGDGGEFGLGLLSRHPILSSRKLELTSEGEQRIAVIWTIDLGDAGLVEVANTHLGLDPDERATQTDELIAFMAENDLPIALLGDFNELPEDTVHGKLTANLDDAWDAAGAGPGPTFPASDPASRIDWILLDRALGAPDDAQVLDSNASDHLPVVADVLVGR